MAHVLSKFKIQDDEFVAKIGVEYGFRMRNIERITNDNSTVTVSALLEYFNKGRIKTFAIREMVSIHPEFLKEYCHFDPDSAIFRIKQRKRTLCLKFPTGKKCWECGITTSSSKVVKIQTCTDCRKGKYCSIGCQVSNWDDHKDFCKKLLELNREIISILHTREVVQDMIFLFGKSSSGNVLTPLGFENNFGERDLDRDTIEIIVKTGCEICRSIARLVNDLNMSS